MVKALIYLGLVAHGLGIISHFAFDSHRPRGRWPEPLYANGQIDWHQWLAISCSPTQ
jgi:hypothetical protein